MAYSSHKSSLCGNSSIERNTLGFQKPSFNFDTKKENSYKLFRENVINNKKELVTKVDGNNSSFLYTDESAKSGEIYEYYVVVTNNESSKEKLSNIIKLMSY